MKSTTLLILLLTILSLTSAYRLTDNCNNFDNENACRGNQTDNDPSWANRSFQTPPRGDPLWKEGYQDYNILVGYAQTTYASGRTSAKVKVITRVNPKYSSATLAYFFNEQEQSSG
jgi:hypothetical protein